MNISDDDDVAVTEATPEVLSTEVLSSLMMVAPDVALSFRTLALRFDRESGESPESEVPQQKPISSSISRRHGSIVPVLYAFL